MKNEFSVSIVSDGVFAIEQKTSMSQAVLYLIVGTEKAALIDTGVKSELNLYNIVAKLTDKPVIVLHTHAHFDHIGNSFRFANVYMHEKEVPVAKAHSDKQYLFNICKENINPLVLFFAKGYAEKIFTFAFNADCKFFNDGDVFDLSGRKLEVIHTPGHTPGSCCFLDRANRLLFSGDSCCNWGVLLQIEYCEPVEVFHRSMCLLQKLESEGAFTVNFPGHHAFPAEKDLARRYKECAESIINKTAIYKPRQKHKVARHEGILIGMPKDYK